MREKSKYWTKRNMKIRKDWIISQQLKNYKKKKSELLRNWLILMSLRKL